jgi:hypothetical protein
MNRITSISLCSILFLCGFLGEAMAAPGHLTDGSANRSNSREESSHQKEHRNNAQGVPIGQFEATFDGVDLKNRAIWLNDFRYTLYPGYKAINHRSRSINISSIPQGARVNVVVENNSKNPITPYLIELRYKR